MKKVLRSIQRQSAIKSNLSYVKSKQIINKLTLTTLAFIVSTKIIGSPLKAVVLH